MSRPVATRSPLSVLTLIVGFFSGAAIALFVSISFPITQTSSVSSIHYPSEFVGRVIDSETQTPIQGAKVLPFIADAPRFVTTNSEGTYQFQATIVGDRLLLRLTIEAPGYRVSHRFLEISAHNTRLDDIQLIAVPPIAVSAIPSQLTLAGDNLVNQPSTPPRRLSAEPDLAQWLTSREPCFERYYSLTEREYHLNVKCPAQLNTTILKQGLVAFDAEVNTRKIAGSDRAWYGLSVVAGRGTEQEERHHFLISGLGAYMYEIRTYDGVARTETGRQIVQAATLDSAIERREITNQLRLIRIGPRVDFLVNDRSLYYTNWNIDSDIEVEVAVTAQLPRDTAESDYIDAAFSDLRIFMPQ
jgi:hypothetical protein